jgi:AcrR family transcriptional regulator
MTHLSPKNVVRKPHKAALAAEAAPALSVVENPKAKTSSTLVVVPSAKPEVLSVPSDQPRRRRGNRRSEQTVENILSATEVVILKSGTERVSILEVCHTAGVSRGTFYRYFASQEELLDAFSRHRRENFHQSLSDALLPCTDPDQRFATMIEFVDAYLLSGRSRRMLLVAPEYALKFFKRIFHDSVVRFQDLLGPVFDAWDESLNAKLDRELICELIVRFMLSEHLVGDDSERRAMPRRIARLVESLRHGGGGLARR